MIQAVIDDLKLETESSIHNRESADPSAIGNAFLNFAPDDQSRITGKLLDIDLNPEVPKIFAQKPQFPLAKPQERPSERLQEQPQEQPEKTTILPPDNGPESAPANTPEPKFEAPKFTPPKPLMIPRDAPLAIPVAPVFPNSGDKFQQAETLKIAQLKIIELEKEVENLRRENIILSSASEMAKHQSEDFRLKIQTLERAHFDLKENGESELKIFKDGLLKKDTEIHRLRSKIDELENRLSNDLKKVRVRERELENRLELARMEKNALVRTKDENILDLKRRNETLESEIEKFQQTVLDLNEKIEGNQEQFSRTVRALRIALTNLEVSENTSSITLAPIKKAE